MLLPYHKAITGIANLSVSCVGEFTTCNINLCVLPVLMREPVIPGHILIPDLSFWEPGKQFEACAYKSSTVSQGRGRDGCCLALKINTHNCTFLLTAFVRNYCSSVKFKIFWGWKFSCFKSSIRFLLFTMISSFNEVIFLS